MRNFNVEVRIYKGLSRTESMRKTVFVGLDDLPNEISEQEIKGYVVSDAEEQLRRSEDYPVYGRNWEIVEVCEA